MGVQNVVYRMELRVDTEGPALLESHQEIEHSA